jgi:4,5-DOPA dioxygenase extradiol
MSRLPSLFVSHGAPNLVLHNTEARQFLEGFGRELPRPKAILLASAHFETAAPAVTADERPATVHDFRGFEPELYRMTYPAPGAPELARRAVTFMRQAGLQAEAVSDHGFDHGTWVPLKLMYPKADIPVVQLSVQPRQGPNHHERMGEALRPLAEEGVLVVGSGSLTHNLQAFFRGGYAPDAPAPDWVTGFAEWMNERLAAGARNDLVAYREKAPHAAENHPTEEHLLPLFVALGAAGEGARGKRVHSSHEYGVLMMDAYVFE